jgi:RimJ/RimL family protein N-acetyltransferase
VLSDEEMKGEEKKKKSVWKKMKVAARILSKPFYASLDELLLEKPVGEDQVPVSFLPLLTWRPAGPDDLDQFAFFLPAFKIRLFKKRFRDREYCLIGVQEGMIVHYCWLALGEEYLDWETAFLINLLPAKAYLYDAFTRPLFRNRGIYREAIHQAIRFLFNRGRTSLMIIVEKDNPPAFAAAVRAGFRPQANIRYRRVLWFRKNRVEPISPSREGSRDGIDLADNK